MQNMNKLSLYDGQDTLAEYGTNLSEDKFLFMRSEMCLNIYETSPYTGMSLKIQQYVETYDVRLERSTYTKHTFLKYIC